MAKVLVSMEERLLRRLDRAAKEAGMSRSAFLSRVLIRALGNDMGPGRSKKVRAALTRLDRLFAEHATAGDPTEIVREMRDAR